MQCAGGGTGPCFQRQVKSICHTSSNRVFSTELISEANEAFCPTAAGKRGSLALTVSSEEDQTRKEGGAGSQRQSEAWQGRETEEHTGQACSGFQSFASSYFFGNKMAGGEGETENTKGTFSTFSLQSRQERNGHGHYHHQHANHHPTSQKALGEKTHKCFPFLSSPAPQQSHESSLYIFAQSEI